jgi:predicted secreted hydrolase
VQREINGKIVRVPQFSVQVTDIDNQKVYAKQLFPDMKNVSISTQTMDVYFGKDLTLHNNNGIFYLDATFTPNNGPRITLSMNLTPTRPVLLIGKTGLVDMWDNTNSYYYSYTHVKSEGLVQIGNEVLELDPGYSLSWMDHQWGDFITLPGNQWMWTSIQMANGIEINLGTILDNKTMEVATGSANIVMPDGSHIYLMHPQDFKYIANSVLGQKHPLSYDVLIPAIDLKVTLTALAKNQDQNGIWEGVSDAEGTYKGDAVSGQAYTENTVKYSN